MVKLVRNYKQWKTVNEIWTSKTKQQEDDGAVRGKEENKIVMVNDIETKLDAMRNHRLKRKYKENH